jgi:pyruvate/2-oxoglutarate dehydrogenase complex dihydrolipoamide acyltransferase (E2) component
MSLVIVISKYIYLQVSVDIRSPLAGVMSELCAKQGDTVQVGAQLFKIDSDGKATATSSPAAAAPAAPAPVAAAPTQAAPAKVEAPAVHSHGRVPMIKFKYGKRGTLNSRLFLFSFSFFRLN